MVVSRDEKFAATTALMRNHGAHPKYYHSLVGGNFRLDPIQAAVLRVKLDYLEKWHQARRDNAALYDRLLVDSNLTVEGLVSIPKAIYREQSIADGTKGKNYHIFNQYILRVQRRDQLRDWLVEHDIGCEIYYPLALHQQKCLGDIALHERYPHAEEAAAQTIALPIYSELTSDMQEHVVKTIVNFYEN